MGGMIFEMHINQCLVVTSSIIRGLPARDCSFVSTVQLAMWVVTGQ